MPERKSHKKKNNFPSTTVIGSYPITVSEQVVDQYRAFPDESEDPVTSTIQLAVRDFVSAGIEYPS
ncbi:MAG: hypothetical protein OK439_05385, partial [Thaumarchaeota archaeon]|nr:hypothetical protein [Nitrososphaerota archaeon]